MRWLPLLLLVCATSAHALQCDDDDDYLDWPEGWTTADPHTLAPRDGDDDWPSDGAIWRLDERAWSPADPPQVWAGDVAVPLVRVDLPPLGFGGHWREPAAVGWRPAEPWQPGTEYRIEGDYGTTIFRSSGAPEVAAGAVVLNAIEIDVSPPAVAVVCGGGWDDRLWLDLSSDAFLSGGRLSAAREDDVTGVHGPGVDRSAPHLLTYFQPGRRYELQPIGIDRAGRVTTGDSTSFVAPLAGCHTTVDLRGALLLLLAPLRRRRA